MKRLLRAIEILAWGAFLAFAALVLALRFWVLPEIERHREDIVAAVSRGIGLPVRVGAIEAGWFGLRPHITLSDVRIHDAQGREALVLPSIHNVVAWRSLLHGELRLHRLAIEGPRLGVRRDAAGDLYVAGIKVAPPHGDTRGGAGLGGLLGHGEVVIRNAEIEWRDELRAAPPLVLSALELRMATSGAALSLGLSARPPAELGSGIELRALVDARGMQPAAWSGRAFLQVGYTDLAAWRPWVDYPVNLRRGQGALRVWMAVENGQVKEGTADVALSGVHMSLADELAPLELVSLHGRVRMRALTDGVELSGRGLALVMERGPEIPPTDFQIVWRPQGGGALGASLLDLEALGHLVDSLPLPPQIAAQLHELAPRGRLADSRLEWTGPFDAPATISARTRFTDLALRPRDGVPGFSGISGSVEAAQDRGKLHLASRKSALELPRIFPQPSLAFDSLAGNLEWQREGAQGFTVRVSSLSFANEHASGNLFGAYAWRGEGPGTVDLSAVLNRADGRSVARYLPHPGLMGEVARNFLASAIVAGDASDVRVRLRGDLRQFPFADPATGQFQVSARIEKGILEYQPGWPRIRDIAGELNIERDRLEVVARGASILGAKLANVRVTIPRVYREAHVLVSGQAEGPTAEFLKFVESSPLRETAGAFTAGLKAAGSGKLRLKLDLPIAEMAKASVAGEYEFAANQVSIAPWLPPVEAAAGSLAFTESSFTLREVRGRLLGGALAVSGGSQPGRGVEVVARGEASVEAAGTLIDNRLGKHLSGSFAYVVNVRAQDGAARIGFESPLRGVESRLPAPLAKSTAESLPLRVDVVPAARGERDRVSVALDGLARAELSRRRQGGAMEVQRTAVWLTPQRDQPIRLPERPGTLVYGSLPAFDLDRWRRLLAGGEDPYPQMALEVRFASLDAFNRRLHNVALRASTEAAGWSANVRADELAGDVSYRARPEPRLIARLARFTVPETQGQVPSAEPQAAAKPSDWPALDLAVEEFTFRGHPLGRVEFVARREGEDLRIEHANMVNPDASLTGNGVWRAAPSHTAIDFDLHAGDVGAFLGRVGQPGMVKGAKARLQGSLTWQGDPATLDLPTLGGQLQLLAENGQFLEIEPGIGKLISLMSLQALPRRITLDFRDVFSKGFQFDRITSGAQLDHGAMNLKEFRMRGSAADVEMRGEADLARETQDLRVRVVPSLALGDGAAIGIGIVNPVAGIAAAIAQRILKNPIGQIFAFDYAVTGTWSDPKVAKILPPPFAETPGN